MILVTKAICKRESVSQWNDMTTKGYLKYLIYRVLTLPGEPGEPGETLK
jgi:hypothetical protein